MPRFFFHLYDDMVSVDDEGTELPDAKAAHECAVKSARAIACQEVLEGHLNLRHRIEVEDERGTPVLTVHFSDVVKLEA
jgi:hypothetical protein